METKIQNTVNKNPDTKKKTLLLGDQDQDCCRSLLVYPGHSEPKKSLKTILFATLLAKNLRMLLAGSYI